MRWFVIGCGNTNRHDDGVGSYVIRHLKDKISDQEVKLFDAGTDGMGVMYMAKGAENLVIVDAKSPEDSPGMIYEVPGDVLAMEPKNSFNLHDFRWDHALYAGKKIFGNNFPKQVKVFLIEGKTLDYHIGLSSEVEEAAEKVVNKIVDFIDSGTSHKIDVSKSKVYLNRNLVNKYFDKVKSVVVIFKDKKLCIYPINQPMAGGCLLKTINKNGDCVVSHFDLFANHNLINWEEKNISVDWDDELKALVTVNPIKNSKNI